MNLFVTCSSPKAATLPSCAEGAQDVQFSRSIGAALRKLEIWGTESAPSQHYHWTMLLFMYHLPKRRSHLSLTVKLENETLGNEVQEMI